MTREDGGSIITVDKVIVHEQYSETTYDNDIALLRLSRRMTLNQTNAQPIRLAYSNYDPSTSTKVMISGWGKTAQNDYIFPTDLLYVWVSVIERTLCSYLYQREGIVTQHMFCAGELRNGQKDSCQGDSGGPVVQGGHLVGIVSWGYGCGDPTKPGVYTRVGTYNTWIKRKIYPK